MQIINIVLVPSASQARQPVWCLSHYVWPHFNATCLTFKMKPVSSHNLAGYKANTTLRRLAYSFSPMLELVSWQSDDNSAGLEANCLKIPRDLEFEGEASSSKVVSTKALHGVKCDRKYHSSFAHPDQFTHFCSCGWEEAKAYTNFHLYSFSVRALAVYYLRCDLKRSALC